MRVIQCGERATDTKEHINERMKGKKNVFSLTNFSIFTLKIVGFRTSGKKLNFSFSHIFFFVVFQRQPTTAAIASDKRSRTEL
jgi:hypothetical protein